MEIRLLGLVEASHDGRDVPLGGAKPRALLSMLALQANAPVSVDRLIDGLWGEQPPATAPKLVQVMVSQLRKQLVDADAEIVTRGRGYELRHRRRWRRRAALRASSGPGRRRPAGAGGARVVARAAARRSRERAVRRAGDPAPRGALARGARGRDRHHAGRGAPQRRAAGRSTSCSASIPCTSRCTRSACSPFTAAADRRKPWRRFVRPPGAPRRGRARARPWAATAQRCDPASGRRPRRPGIGAAARAPRPRRSRGAARAAAVAIAAAVALTVTELGGSDGLDRISEDSAGAIDAGSGRITAQYAVGHAPDRARGRAPARCGAPTAATAPSPASTATGRSGRSTSAGSRPRSPSAAARSGSPTARTAASTRSTPPRTASSTACPPGTRRAAWRSRAARCGSRRRSTGRWQRIDLTRGRPGSADRRGRRAGGDRGGRRRRMGGR